MSKRFLVLILLSIAVGTAACSSDDGGSVTASGSGSGSGSSEKNPSADCKIVDGTTNKRDAEVQATLTEWSITLDRNTVSAGNVEFDTANKGNQKHELVILKGVTPGAIKLTDDGVDEKTLPAGAEVLGEIEAFKAGKKCPGTFKLAAGDYTLLCNVVEDKPMAGMQGMRSHAMLGMITGFTVR